MREIDFRLFKNKEDPEHRGKVGRETGGRREGMGYASLNVSLSPLATYRGIRGAMVQADASISNSWLSKILGEADN